MDFLQEFYVAYKLETGDSRIHTEDSSSVVVYSICHRAGNFESDTKLGMEEVYVWMVRTSYQNSSSHLHIPEPVLCNMSQCHPAPYRHHVLHNMVVPPLRRWLLLADLRPPRDTSLR